MITQGRRRLDVDETHLPSDTQPGDYWFDFDSKIWFCMTPSRFIGNLGNHTITEHDDGTITVSPSILVTETMGNKRMSWHGYLERGVWKEC